MVAKLLVFVSVFMFVGGIAGMLIPHSGQGSWLAVVVAVVVAFYCAGAVK